MEAQKVTPLVFEKPNAAVINVTPDLARRWLDLNTRNRKVKPIVVAAYARDMANGEWKLTGEPIKFCIDGSLLDGQHRLKAVVSANVTVQMFVVRGLRADAQEAMDTGAKRNAYDMLAMQGERDASLLAAAARIALTFQDPNEQRNSLAQVTNAEVRNFIDRNPDLRAAAQFARHVARRTDCLPAVVAYTYWRLSRINLNEAADFWTSAADKIGLTRGDPVIALTNRFAEARRNRERLPVRVYLSMIYRAWNVRREGKTMTFIRVNSPAGGIVPIPEPK